MGRTQALLLLATKALRELVLCFFLPEIEGRIKDGERKKKRLSLVRGYTRTNEKRGLFSKEAYKKFAGIHGVVWELQWAAESHLSATRAVLNLCVCRPIYLRDSQQLSGREGSS